MEARKKEEAIKAQQIALDRAQQIMAAKKRQELLTGPALVEAQQISDKGLEALRAKRIAELAAEAEKAKQEAIRKRAEYDRIREERQRPKL